MKKVTLFIASVFMAVLAAFPAAAQEKELGKFGAWRAFSQEAGGQTVCFMVTTQAAKPNDMRHTPPYLMITHRPIEASRDVFSYGAGITLNSKRAPKIKIGASSFELFSARDTAWARDATLDHRIARSIKEAKQVTVTAYPDAKGIKPISDRFDVTGAAAAYRAIGIACGLISPDAPKAAAPSKKQVAPTAKKGKNLTQAPSKTPAASPAPVKEKKKAVAPAKSTKAKAKTTSKKQQPDAKTKTTAQKKAPAAKKATTSVKKKEPVKKTTKKTIKKKTKSTKEP